MTKKISVYDQVTGRKVFIPATWLGREHPQFSRFRRTPSRRNRVQNPAPEPVTTEADAIQAPDSSNPDQERQ